MLKSFLIGFAVWIFIFSTLTYFMLTRPIEYLMKAYGYEAAKGIYARGVEGGIFAAFLISSLVVLCGWFFLTERR